MMKKFMALLIAVFMMFSSITVVHGAFKKDPTKYPGQSEAADAIIEAIKDNDVEKIESMFNTESRDGIKDLHQKIETLFSCIDGDIISHKSYGSFQSDKIDSGYRYSKVGFYIIIDTENSKYWLSVNWIKKHSSKPEKVGITAIRLFLIDDEENTIDFWEGISLTTRISVTYKKELDLYRDPGAIAHYNSLGYDSVVLTSSDESVLTVSQDGFVTTKGPGTAIVTETLTNTKTGKVVKDEYEITVELKFWQKFIWYCLFGFLWY